MRVKFLQSWIFMDSYNIDNSFACKSFISNETELPDNAATNRIVTAEIINYLYALVYIILVWCFCVYRLISSAGQF
jgi:hypothetical protein